MVVEDALFGAEKRGLFLVVEIIQGWQEEIYQETLPYPGIGQFNKPANIQSKLAQEVVQMHSVSTTCTTLSRMKPALKSIFSGISGMFSRRAL
jgi:hypothetical protein